MAALLSNPPPAVTSRPLSKHMYPPGGKDSFSLSEGPAFNLKIRGSPGGKDSIILTDKGPTPTVATNSLPRVPPGGKDSIKLASRSFRLDKSPPSRNVPPCGKDHIVFGSADPVAERPHTASHRVPPGGADHIDFTNHRTSKVTPSKAHPTSTRTDIMKSMLCDGKKEEGTYGRDLMPGASSQKMQGVLSGNQEGSSIKPVRIRYATTAQTFSLG